MERISFNLAGRYACVPLVYLEDKKSYTLLKKLPKQLSKESYEKSVLKNTTQVTEDKYINIRNSRGKPIKTFKCWSGNIHVVHTPIRCFKKLRNDKIANLVVPAGALINVNHTDIIHSHKYRANLAYVSSIYCPIEGRFVSQGESLFDRFFEYHTSGRVSLFADEFDTESGHNCSKGIHFFTDIRYAVTYRP